MANDDPNSEPVSVAREDNTSLYKLIAELIAMFGNLEAETDRAASRQKVQKS